MLRQLFFLLLFSSYASAICLSGYYTICTQLWTRLECLCDACEPCNEGYRLIKPCDGLGTNPMDRICDSSTTTTSLTSTLSTTPTTSATSTFSTAANLIASADKKAGNLLDVGYIVVGTLAFVCCILAFIWKKKQQSTASKIPLEERLSKNEPPLYSPEPIYEDPDALIYENLEVYRPYEAPIKNFVLTNSLYEA